MDATPRLYVELVLWTLCLRDACPHLRRVLYVTGDVPRPLLDWVAAHGVEVRPSTPAVPGAPHASKLLPFFDGTANDTTLVCDLDLYVLRDPSDLLRGAPIHAAPNNHANPSPDVLRRVFEDAGHAYRPTATLFGSQMPDRRGHRETARNNISAGIVAAIGLAAPQLAEAWGARARWLAERKEILCRWGVHVDQVSFALAMEDLGQDVAFLPPQANAVLELVPLVETIYALHLTTGHVPAYGHMFADGGGLRPDAAPEAARPALERFDALVREARGVIAGWPLLAPLEEMFLNPQWRRNG